MPRPLEWVSIPRVVARWRSSVARTAARATSSALCTAKSPSSTERTDRRAFLRVRRCLPDMARAHGQRGEDRTSVLVAVYGPMEVPARQERIDAAVVEVSFIPLSGGFFSIGVRVARH
jgi:hypothetical protein